MFGNLVGQTDTAGQGQQNVYGGYGRLVTSVDQGGGRTDFGYDAFGRKISETGGGRNIVYRYDAAGHLSAISDYATGTYTTYGYDLAGRQVQQSVTSAADVFGQVHTRQLATSYDGLGRMTHWRDSVTGLEETITYDSAGNRTRVEGNNNGAAGSTM